MVCFFVGVYKVVLWIILVVSNNWLVVRGRGCFVNNNGVSSVLMVCFFIFVVLMIVVGYCCVLKFIIFWIFKFWVIN